jgi:hypothetical protein
MGGGLLQLVSYGIQDEILISNPEITFFKTVHRKYTNFSIDTLNTNHEINFNSNQSIQIPKTGELLYKLVIKLELPKVVAYYNTTTEENIYKIISDIVYNYNIILYDKNMAIIKNIFNLTNNKINELENNKINMEYFTYIDSDNNFNKIYNIFESSNLMNLDLDLNNIKQISDTEYYSNRYILNTQSNPTIKQLTLLYNFKIINYFNERNYFIETDQTYVQNYIKLIKSLFGIIYTNNDLSNTINKMLLKTTIESIFDKINYNLSTSYNYYNNFHDQLIINAMPNEIFRQDYIMTKHGYLNINNLMPNLGINGKILTYNNLTNIPTYLVFVDKTDPSILIPIIITESFPYTSIDSNTLLTKYYFDYTGYIANIDFFDRVINYTSQNNSSTMVRSIHLNQTIINNIDSKYNQIEIILPVLNILSSKSSDNLSYIYDIQIDLTFIVDQNNKINILNTLLTTINNLKYLTYTYNSNGRSDYKNLFNDALYKLPPFAILLLDPNLKSTYSETNGFHIYCKNSAKPYDVSNINILDSYIPVITSNGTFFNTTLSNTDYKNQVEYLINNYLQTNDAIETVTLYTNYMFNILNQFKNTFALSISNTIDKSTYELNLNTQFNLTQLNDFKNYLRLNENINNTLLIKINDQFNIFYDALINSYQYISISSTNKTVFEEILHLYMMTIEYKKQLDPSIVLFSNSFDTSSLLTIIYTDTIADTITYNDIILKSLTNIYKISTEIYKFRLYPYDAFVSTAVNIFTDLQIKYVKTNNQIYVDKTILYKSPQTKITDTYVIRYKYLFMQLIEVNSSYIDLYIQPSYILFKNGVEIKDTGDYTFINQQKSFLPNQFDTQYNANSLTDANINFTMYYKDQSGNKINAKYNLKNYYLAQPMTTSSMENIWFIQQKYNNIYDIISFPSYYYGKFQIDIINLPPIELQNISNIYMHDIYIMILYNAYTKILINDNNNISNIIGLIIQDIGYLISSYFKDPAITLNNNTSYQINSSNNSLESLAADLDQYKNLTKSSNSTYNLFNIFSNSLALGSDLIYNTTYELIYRLDKHCMNYINNLLIFNQQYLTNIIRTIFNANKEKYLNVNQAITFFNNNYMSQHVYDIINLMGQKVQTNSDGSLKQLIPIYIGTDPNPNNVLNQSTTYNILNNILIYSSAIDTNKDILLNQTYGILILFYKSNLNKMNFESYYDMNKLFLIPMTTGIYKNYFKFSDLYQIINDSIKMYFQVYLMRSPVLDESIDPIEIPGSNKTNIINLFTDQVNDYTSYNEISNALENLYQSRIISNDVKQTIITNTIDVLNESTIVSLIADNAPNVLPDPYKYTLGLSYFRGLKLLNYVLKNIYIFNNDFFINAQYNLTQYSTIKSDILTMEVYNSIIVPSIPSTPSTPSVPSTNIIYDTYNKTIPSIKYDLYSMFDTMTMPSVLFNTYFYLTNNDPNKLLLVDPPTDISILTGGILYDFKLNLLNITDESYYDIDNILIIKMRSQTGLYFNKFKYTDLYQIINNSIRSYFQIYLLRSDIFSYSYDVKTNIINLFLNQITDFTSYEQIDTVLEYLVINNYITPNEKLIIKTYTIDIKYPNDIIGLLDDNFSDIYQRLNGLSYYRGTQLLKSICDVINVNYYQSSTSISQISNDFNNLLNINYQTLLNLYIYSTNNDQNKILLVDLPNEPDNFIGGILYDFRSNLSNPTNESYYDIDNLLITKMRSQTGIYYTNLKYGDLFQIINKSIQTYFQIYLLRSTVLDNYNTKILIISTFVARIIDYTSYNQILSALNYLVVKSMISQNTFNTIRANTININLLSDVISLELDPLIINDIDNLTRANGLSYYRGTQLLKSISDNILINNFQIYNGLNDPNKTLLINPSDGILVVFTQELSNTTDESYYDTNKYFFDQMSLDTGTFYTNFLYSDLKKIINDSIRIYLEIYLLRSDVLNSDILNYNTLNTVNRYIAKNQIINVFKNLISDYTSYGQINASLNNLVTKQKIKSSTKNIIQTNTIDIGSELNIIGLINTPIDDLDTYSRSDGLSYYRGIKLLKLIIKNTKSNTDAKFISTQVNYLNKKIDTQVSSVLDPIQIYNTSNSPNKILLVNPPNGPSDLTSGLLFDFKNNLKLTTNELYYNIDGLLITKMRTQNQIYYTNFKYENLFQVINNSIQIYFEIYLLRSGVLAVSDPTIIISKFTEQITDFTSYNQINASLDNLVRTNLISLNVSNTIKNNTINVGSESNIVGLIIDPSISDNYLRANGLSYYRGVKLLLELNSIINYYDFLPTLKSNIITSTIVSLRLFPSEPTNIYQIKSRLNDITYYPMIQNTTAQQIINSLNLYDFDTNAINKLSDSNIKLIYLNGSKLTTTHVYIGSSINSVSNILTNNIEGFSIYDFIGELIKTTIMTTNSDLINQIIELYNLSLNNQIFNIFTNNLMISIVNLCNTTAISSINSLIVHLNTLVNNQILSKLVSNSIIIKNLNPLDYDQFIYFGDLHYYDKIFYLYNYLVSQFYDQPNIDIGPTYDPSNTTSQYTIYISETIDNTYDINNINNKFIGPTLKINFNIYDTLSTTKVKKYYRTNYFMSITLNNINAIFNYFSKVLNDPINYNISYTTSPAVLNSLDTIFMNYNNYNSTYLVIAGLLNYIGKYIGLINQTIISIINSNPITKIIFANLNLFVFLLINISNNYNLGNLVDNSYSLVNNQIYILKILKEVDPIYQAIFIPNILNYKSDTYLDQISNNDFNTYLKGILKYNINKSSYINFDQIINDQRQSYINFYKTLINVGDIGINTQSYVDYYSLIQQFVFEAENIATSTFVSKSLQQTFNIQQTNFKTNYTLINQTGTSNTYNAFIDLLLYYKTNLSLYKNKIPDINIIDVKYDINKYYSDINGFYSYIFQTSKTSQYLTNILNNKLIYYRSRDVQTLNKCLTNILNTTIMDVGILDTGLKSAFINTNLNVAQIIDLSNFNIYLSNSINNLYQNNLNVLISDFANLLKPNYNGTNSANNFIIYKPIIPILTNNQNNQNNQNKQIVINNYIGTFYITTLNKLPNKTQVNLNMSNVKVKTKIDNSMEAFNILSHGERQNVIKISNDKSLINGYLFHMNSLNESIEKLSTYIDYTYYDIIMTTAEYNAIFGLGANYNWTTQSIGILMFDKASGNKIDPTLSMLPLKPNSLVYEFKLYRKTDLPLEYEYIFDNQTSTILNIKLKHQINDLFTDVYNQISIYGDNTNIINTIAKSFYAISYSESNDDLININKMYSNLNISEIAKQLNLINYYFNLYPINLIGLTINNINNCIQTFVAYNDIWMVLDNPISVFNYLYCGFYLQSDLMLKNDQELNPSNHQNSSNPTYNYVGNLTIELYKKFPIIPNDPIDKITNLYKSMLEKKPLDTLNIITYIEYIESTYNYKTSSTNIGTIIRSQLKLNNQTSTQILTSDIQKQQITVVGDIQVQSKLINLLCINNFNYTSNITIELYNNIYKLINLWFESMTILYPIQISYIIAYIEYIESIYNNKIIRTSIPAPPAVPPITNNLGTIIINYLFYKNPCRIILINDTLVPTPTNAISDNNNSIQSLFVYSILINDIKIYGASYVGDPNNPTYNYAANLTILLYKNFSDQIMESFRSIFVLDNVNTLIIIQSMEYIETTFNAKTTNFNGDVVLYTNNIGTIIRLNLNIPKLPSLNALSIQINNNSSLETILLNQISIENYNYAANITLLLTNALIQNQVINFYKVLNTTYEQITLQHISYIEYIETTYNAQIPATNIGTIIRNQLGITQTTNIDTNYISKQFIELPENITIERSLFDPVKIYNYDYCANFIVELYMFNENLGFVNISKPLESNNPTYELMNDIFLNYNDMYICLMNRMMYLSLTNEIFINIETYIKNKNPQIPYPILAQTQTPLINIINKTPELYYINILYSDEQKNKFDSSKCKFVMGDSNDIIIDLNPSQSNQIQLNNILLSESHKLLKINKSLPFESYNLYQIDHINNFTKIIFINYPYDLLFTKPIDITIGIIENRKQNNIITVDYNKTFTIYQMDQTSYTYETKYIDFNKDFIVGLIMINGIEYNIWDIKLRPYSSTTFDNIPALYYKSNIMEIGLDNNIKINKDYLNNDSVQLYCNNLNELYISENFYINNDQIIIKSKIIGIGSYYSVIKLLGLIDNLQYISNIETGFENILKISNNKIICDPSTIQIIGTNNYHIYTLSDILSKFDTSILANMIINKPISKTNILTTVQNYNSKYYSDLYQIISNGDFMANIITQIVNNLINNNSSTSSQQFINDYPPSKYPLMTTNNKNYKLNIFNYFDNINYNLGLILILQNILNINLNDSNTSEITYYGKRKILYDSIIEYISKPEIAVFSYIPYLADFIFRKIDLKIDGISVDEINNAYLYIYHNIISNVSKRIGYQKINSNDETLLIESNTKDSIMLYIDVPLYFSQIPGLSLPLISTLFSNIELDLNIRSLEDIIIKNKFTSVKYKNLIKMSLIYSVIYLDDYERELFSVKRHEYLYERKKYIPNIQLNPQKQEQDRYHIPLEQPIKYIFYYTQNQRMIDAKQYYNFTFDYLLPELNMSTRSKLIYLEQVIKNQMYDGKIYDLYTKIIKLLHDKISKYKIRLNITNNTQIQQMQQVITNNINLLNLNLNNLKFLYNNLTIEDQIFIENAFNNYYEIKLQSNTVDQIQLFFNSVERSKLSNFDSNLIVPYQSFNNMICGLYIINFSLYPLEYQPSGNANFNSLRPEIKITLASNNLKLKSTDIINSYIIAHTYNIMRFIGGIAGMAW